MTTASRPRAARARRAVRPSGDDREQAILETAKRLLDERSFADISVDDLAKGAGISRPTFYFYFPSKDAVLVALVAQVITAADQTFQSLVDLKAGQKVPIRVEYASDASIVGSTRVATGVPEKSGTCGV